MVGGTWLVDELNEQNVARSDAIDAMPLTRFKAVTCDPAQALVIRQAREAAGPISEN